MFSFLFLYMGCTDSIFIVLLDCLLAFLMTALLHSQKTTYVEKQESRGKQEIELMRRSRVPNR